MNGLSRLTSMLMTAALASIAASGKAVLGDYSAGMGKSLKPIKTKAASSSKGDRAYGANKLGTTAAFVRAATKARNVRRHRIACR